MRSTLTLVCIIGLVSLIVYYLNRGESGKTIRTGEIWLIFFGALFLAGLILCLVMRTGEARPDSHGWFLTRSVVDLPRGLMLPAALWSVVCVLAGILSLLLGKREGRGTLPMVLSGILLVASAGFMLLLRASFSIWLFIASAGLFLGYLKRYLDRRKSGE